MKINYIINLLISSEFDISLKSASCSLSYSNIVIHCLQHALDCCPVATGLEYRLFVVEDVLDFFCSTRFMHLMGFSNLEPLAIESLVLFLQAVVLSNRHDQREFALLCHLQGDLC